MTYFQACCGPSQKGRVHIRITMKDGSKPILVLCEAVCPARDIKGAINGDLICGKCMKRAGQLLVAAGESTLFNAETIGVSEII